jgi:hypothetical protein
MSTTVQFLCHKINFNIIPSPIQCHVSKAIYYFQVFQLQFYNAQFENKLDKFTILRADNKNTSQH